MESECIESARKAANLGKRKLTFKSTWCKEAKKHKRLEGQSYISLSGKQVKEKKFSFVIKCCKKECHKEFNSDQQESIFNIFWKSESKSIQDTFLATCVSVKPKTNHSRKKINPKINRINIWQYSLKNNGTNYPVCLKFLLNLLQVSMKRMRILQRKVQNGDTFEERRGKHENRPHKVNDDVWELMKSHVHSFPYKKSHYCQHKSSLNYFNNPNLNVKKLYKSFEIYYKQKTGKTLTIGYNWYFKTFKEKCNFSFRQPKTDVCDFCVKYTKKLEADPRDPCKSEFETHKESYKLYFKIKNKYINEANNNDTVLVCEFDYAQNFAVPKLNVTSQFYKRLLWLYAFNIHIHNDGTSFMYNFMEHEAKKNADSVISFLNECLTEKLKENPHITMVVLLSDAAAGQNKNAAMVSFCLWFSRMFDVKIIHLFPVRGHSFGQCDRNFGLIRSYLKKEETISTAKKYLEAMVLCRENPSPFKIIMDHTLIKNWTEALSVFFMKHPTSKGKQFTIRKYVKMSFEPNGSLHTYEKYSSDFVPFKFWKKAYNKEQLKSIQLKQVESPGLKVNKETDVRSLLQYLDEDSRIWLENVFQAIKTVPTEPNEDEFISTDEEEK